MFLPRRVGDLKTDRLTKRPMFCQDLGKIAYHGIQMQEQNSMKMIVRLAVFGPRPRVLMPTPAQILLSYSI
eukprot:12403618-Karenia_brevis.AAC.1